jgi:hypothetical protein
MKRVNLHLSFGSERLLSTARPREAQRLRQFSEQSSLRGAAPPGDQRLPCAKDLPGFGDSGTLIVYTNPHRFRRNHSVPRIATNDRKNGQVSQ